MIAVIIGRANCVWDDLDEVEHLLRGLWGNPKAVQVIAINSVGVHYRHHIDHWASFHPELMLGWMQARRENGYSDGYKLWSYSNGRRLGPAGSRMEVHTVEGSGGSSGMIALKVALKIGANQIILAGVPMEDSYGHFDSPGPWDEADIHRKQWEKIEPDTKQRIRSISGWTRRFFGYPTEEWIDVDWDQMA